MPTPYRHTVRTRYTSTAMRNGQFNIYSGNYDPAPTVSLDIPFGSTTGYGANGFVNVDNSTKVSDHNPGTLSYLGPASSVKTVMYPPKTSY